MSNIDTKEAKDEANKYVNPRSAQIGEYNTFIRNYLQDEPGDSPVLKDCKEFLKKNILLMRNASGSAKDQLIKIINNLQSDYLPKGDRAPTVPEVAEKCCEAALPAIKKFANCTPDRIPICYCCNLPIITLTELTTIKTNLGKVAEENKPEVCKTDEELNKEWSTIVKTLRKKLFKELLKHLKRLTM